MAEEIDHLDETVLYKGKYPFPSLTTEKFVEEVVEMDVRDDDIFIITYQKSGTHWMQEVVNLILIKGELEKLTSKDRRLVIELANVNSMDQVEVKGPTLWEVKDAPSPRVLTTHMGYKFLPRQIREKRCKMIYVYRNGKDVFASKYNFYRNIYKQLHGVPVSHSPELFSKFFDDVVAGNCSYGSWFEHVLGYYEHKDNDNFFVVSYEDMKKDLRKIVMELASFLGHHLNEDQVNRVIHGASLETMRKSYMKEHLQNVQEGDHAFDASTMVATGTLNQWREFFTAEQTRRFDDTFRELMGDCEWTKPYSPDVPSEALN